MASRTLGLRCIPPYDRVLAEVAERELQDPHAADPATLEARIRRTYPRAIVREREGLAGFGPLFPVWYVYRDGRYSPYGEDRDWWLEPGLPRVVIDDSDRYLDANEAARALFGVDAAELRASPPGSFTSPEIAGLVPWIMEQLRETGVLDSTSILIPRGGRPPVPVQFHLVRDGDGPGRHVSILRPVPWTVAARDGTGELAG